MKAGAAASNMGSHTGAAPVLVFGLASDDRLLIET